MAFSANLGFLWTELSLLEAIFAAKEAGFDAVECHWPYEVPVDAVRDALQTTGLRMLGLNTRRGDVSKGENGLAALPGREAEARLVIDEAIDYARCIDTPNIHVMAGFASGDAARSVFIDNLKYACEQAALNQMTILIEPLNHYDAPGYFLQTTDQACEIISEVGAANLKLMFDCYHVQLMEGNLTRKLETLLPLIGHVQFASVPDRGVPDHGEVDFRHIFRVLNDLGYSAPLGAEYRPEGRTEDSLGWLKASI